LLLETAKKVPNKKLAGKQWNESIMLIYLGAIWYHSEPSDVPYSSNQYLGWGFFYHFLQQDSSREVFKNIS
jgi:hypothetical protein